VWSSSHLLGLEGVALATSVRLEGGSPEPRAGACADSRMGWRHAIWILHVKFIRE
jgi:hypothetical protein